MADPDVLKHIMVKDFLHFQDRPRRVWVHFSCICMCILNLILNNRIFQSFVLHAIRWERAITPVFACTQWVTLHYCTHIISCHFLVLEKNINFKCLDFMNSLWLGRREINNYKYYTVLYTILRFMKKMGLYIKIAKKCSMVNLFLYSVFLCLILVQVHIDTCFAISNEFLLLTLKIFLKTNCTCILVVSFSIIYCEPTFIREQEMFTRFGKASSSWIFFVVKQSLPYGCYENTGMDKARSWK